MVRWIRLFCLKYMEHSRDSALFKMTIVGTLQTWPRDGVKPAEGNALKCMYNGSVRMYIFQFITFPIQNCDDTILHNLNWKKEVKSISLETRMDCSWRNNNYVCFELLFLSYILKLFYGRQSIKNDMERQDSRYFVQIIIKINLIFHSTVFG